MIIFLSIPKDLLQVVVADARTFDARIIADVLLVDQPLALGAFQRFDALRQRNVAGAEFGEGVGFR